MILGEALRRCLGLLVVMLIVGACSSSTQSRTAGPPTASFAKALGYVPQDAGIVTYADWAALGHPTQPWTSPTFATALTDSAARIEAAVGVKITDADWEVDSAAPDQSASLGLPHADLLKFVDGLARAGFARQTRGSVTTLTCADEAAPCGVAGWAFGDFRVDLGAGVLTEYDRGRAPATPSSAFGDRFRTLLAHTHAPVSAYLRVGADACESTGLRQRHPLPSPQVISRLDAVVGKFSVVRGVLVTVDKRSAPGASGYVELAGSARATAELEARATVQARLNPSNPPLHIEAVRADGAIDIYTLSATPSRALFDAARTDHFGIGICPTS
jgi:hypothetical protein